MSVEVTIQAPDQIIVQAIGSNEYNVIVTAQSAIQVSVSPQSGLPGLKGDIGIGVPTGGSTKQVLVKKGTADYDFEWSNNDVPAGLNKEVQFNDAGLLGSDAEFLFDKDLKALSVGRPTLLPNVTIAAGGDVDGYVQVTVQNINDGIDASSDFVATADNGDDESNYIDFGINNSNYADEEFNASIGDDGYLIVNGHDLLIGTINPGTKTKLLAGGVTTGSVIGSFDSSGINLSSGIKYKENGFNLTDLIMEANGATAETAAFALGAKICIRTDLI